MFENASKLCEDEKYTHALKYYKNILRIESDNVVAIIDYDVTLQNLGRHRQALEMYNRALTINPKNLDANDENQNPGRGIQYPFKQPEPGQYHSEWREEALEPWKETIRALMRHHRADETNKLNQISTEFIPAFDYGQGCKYSLFEQSISCVRWMREAWKEIQTVTKS